MLSECTAQSKLDRQPRFLRFGHQTRSQSKLRSGPDASEQDFVLDSSAILVLNIALDEGEISFLIENYRRVRRQRFRDICNVVREVAKGRQRRSPWP